jgi:enoyl-CoA hydratase
MAANTNQEDFGMDYQTLILERREKIGFITLNRPKQLNTFSSVLAVEFNRALDECES